MIIIKKKKSCPVQIVEIYVGAQKTILMEVV